MPHPICLLSLPRLVLLLVSHLVVRLVAIVLPSMCFSCVFQFIRRRPVPALFVPVPVSFRRLVASSRRASRAAAGIVMCLLDLLPMAFSSRSYRLVGRDGERDGTMIFRNRFHDIFMYSESIAVNIGHPI